MKELKTENLSLSNICKSDNMQTEYEKVLMNNRGTKQPKNKIAMVPAYTECCS